jgi:hypothetical protein
MALNDDAVLVPGKAHILTGTVGAVTKPTLAALTTFAGDTATPPAGFTDIGHTDLEDVLTFGQEGGETEVKGSWQNPSLRETTTAEAIDYYVIKSLQVLDNDALTLYFGGGDATVANEFALPDSPAPQERAALVVFLDGATPLGFFTPKVSIRREDAIEVANDDFMKMPLRFTVVKASGEKKAIWIGDPLGAAV